MQLYSFQGAYSIGPGAGRPEKSESKSLFLIIFFIRIIFLEEVKTYLPGPSSYSIV